jgi:hypothetical protein
MPGSAVPSSEERQIGAAPALPWVILGLAATFGAAIALRALFPVQTPALGNCPLDVKFEQLHVVITRRGDRLQVECMYLGSRGTYGARR